MTESSSEPPPTPPATGAADSPPQETRRERLSREGRHTFLYVWTFAIVAALVILIALILANTRRVQVSWVVGDARTSLIWVIVVSALVGWLGGIATAVLFRRRTRRRG
jgi:uncharacterized integral membrane protein